MTHAHSIQNRLIQAYDATSLATSSMKELGALFHAIQKADDATARDLASIGQFVTEHWVGIVEYEKSELGKLM